MSVSELVKAILTAAPLNYAPSFVFLDHANAPEDDHILVFPRNERPSTKDKLKNYFLDDIAIILTRADNGTNTADALYLEKNQIIDRIADWQPTTEIHRGLIVNDSPIFKKDSGAFWVWSGLFRLEGQK